MKNESAFLTHLKEQRITFSQSTDKYNAYPAPRIPVSGIPLYYAEAVEDFTVNYPFYMERRGVHAYYILYTISGRGQLIYHDQTILLEPDSVIFIDGNSSFRFEIYDQNPWHFKAVYLNGPSLFYYYRTFCYGEQFHCQMTPLSKISETLDMISDLMHDPTRNYDVHISKYITDLLTILADARDYANQKENLVPKYVLEVKRKFDYQYSNSHSLEQLAGECRISKYQLAHEFTKHVGMPPISYLNKKRIHESMKLLRTTDETVSAIGILVGIENTTHFIHLFKKEVGFTPLQYRKYSDS